MEADTGDEIWRFETGKSIKSSPVVADDTVFCGGGDRNLYAVDVASGAEKWKFNVGRKINGVSPISVAESMVFVGGNHVSPYVVSTEQEE